MPLINRLWIVVFLTVTLTACASSIPKPGDSSRKRAEYKKTAKASSFSVKGDYLKIGSCYHIQKETRFAQIRRIPGNTMFATGYPEKNAFVYTMKNRTIMGTSPLLVIDFTPQGKGQTLVTIHSKKGLFGNAFGSPTDAVKKELASCLPS